MKGERLVKELSSWLCFAKDMYLQIAILPIFLACAMYFASNFESPLLFFYLAVLIIIIFMVKKMYDCVVEIRTLKALLKKNNIDYSDIELGGLDDVVDE